MITIALLKHHPYAIPKLAEIWTQGLGEICAPDKTIDEIEAWLNSWLHTDTLPLAHIALMNHQPIGICSLQVNDGIRPDLTPWLGDLCVDPSFQKQGVGKQLIQATQEKAKSLGFEKLYLYTFDKVASDYYKTLGWGILGMDRCAGRPVTIMKISL